MHVVPQSWVQDIAVLMKDSNQLSHQLAHGIHCMDSRTHLLYNIICAQTFTLAHSITYINTVHREEYRKLLFHYKIVLVRPYTLFDRGIHGEYCSYRCHAMVKYYFVWH